MVVGYGDSYTVFCSPDPATTSWPFRFKDGYLDKRFVKMRRRDMAGKWWTVAVHPNTSFSDDYTLITEPLQSSSIVEIYRDTPKDQPLVIYGNGGKLLLDESRNVAARQSMHVVAELREASHRTDLVCRCVCELAMQSPTQL